MRTEKAMQDQDDSGRHILTLMRGTLAEWQGLAADDIPMSRELRCQECGNLIWVDAALVRRGDYFCDGTTHVTYRQHRPGEPGILEVFEGSETPLRGDVLKSVTSLIMNIKHDVERLEAWVYMFGRPDDYDDGGPGGEYDGHDDA